MINNKFYYNYIVAYDSLNKFNYKSIKNIPKVNKIVFSFIYKNPNSKNILISLFILKILTLQKGFLLKSKKINIKLKIKKGSPIGCKVTIKKKNLYTIFFILISKINIIINNNNSKTFDFNLKKLLIFEELSNYYYYLNYLSSLKITLVTNSKNSEELRFLAKSFKIFL